MSLSLYSHYFLAVVTLILVGIWYGTYRLSLSTRQKQWLVDSTLAAIPLAILAQWLWPWSLNQLSLLTGWGSLFIIVLMSLVLGLITTWTRRLLRPHFSQPLQFSWNKYLLIMLILVVAAAMARQTTWPKDMIVTAVMAAVVVFSLVISRSLALLLSQIIGGVVMAICVILLFSLSALFTPLNDPWQYSFIHIGLNGWQLAAIALTAAAWPVLIDWWTGQSIQRA